MAPVQQGSRAHLKAGLAGLALVFDLDEAPTIAAALVVPGNSAQPQVKTVVLPFATEALPYKGDLTTAWGSHEGATMLT